jgi:hypothetical protein
MLLLKSCQSTRASLAGQRFQYRKEQRRTNETYRLQNIHALETFFRFAFGLSDSSSAVFAFERLLPLLLLELFPFACCFADVDGASPAKDDVGISPLFMLPCTASASSHTAR